MSRTPGPASALPAPQEKAVHVRRMFSQIAPRYDLLNHVLSLNIDKVWRRRAVDRLGWERVPDGTYLDNCAGTLDLAVELARRAGFRGRVVGSDFTFAMLERGLGKVEQLPVDPCCADALALPFGDASFDGATVGFGVRNLADLDAGLDEFARVLRPGARLVILEFTTPQWQPFRALYFFYFLRVLPFIGRLISKHGSAYSYLPESVLHFPEPKELGQRMQRAGFDGVGWKMLSGGIAALHWGTRR
ncbi:MAG TPA: bifunctional demethylmenaquinone methyltransferase/2-methoxy-6-polyprenyl-1,4-benzoquinol methylase UbiE [Longimicrobiaceae bacterium]|nr:bifunctional demethylmenaquinone methyltransferase/2-methoxy-6-polyprenyl-1,4-benzoquinol methylase UbiE [Longimicrobiaceae bacterium]